MNNPNNHLFQIMKYSDFQKAQEEKKIGAVLSCEGAACFPPDFKLLEDIAFKGLKVLSFVWKFPNQYTCSWYTLKGEDYPNFGLTEDGYKLLDKTRDLNIVVDVSHLSEEGFWDIINDTDKPIIATHSNAQTIKLHRRNLTDKQIKAIADSGGVVGINFWTNVLDPLQRNKYQDLGFDILKKHIDHIRDIGGIESVAFGSDFDGAVVPHCVENASEYPQLLKYLLNNGYSKTELQKISSENVLRVFKEIW